jgi:imidazolonepropionase-like amidohydrolase
MLVLRNARVATMTGAQAAAGNAPLGLIEGGAVACEGERIAYVGLAAQAPPGCCSRPASSIPTRI